MSQPTSDFLSSGTARALTTLILNPLTVLRTRMELVGAEGYGSLSSAATKIYTEEGFRGFMRGSTICIIRDVPFFAILYSCLNIFKKHFEKYNISSS
mmetsp:Transcript_33395/g.30387  ORF Transcript_33395/g.30387 Transcript_33395/m.30387 type:complete len:97 (+) Transcript_33395:412-702(+)